MLLKIEEVKSIILFRALQLGDLLCSIPAIRALRQAYPSAEITLCSLPWARSLLDRFPEYFDHFMVFSGYPGLPEQNLNPLDFTRFLTEVQSRQFDLALQMQGNGSIVNPMVELFGAKFTAGFYRPDHYYPSNGLFVEYPDYGSEVTRHLHLMAHLGIPHQGTYLEFPLNEKDEKDLTSANLEFEAGNYVCIHPGSRGAWRQWSVEYFASLADHCAEMGYTPVITGTPDEMNIVQAVKDKMVSQPVIAAGKTSLGAVGVLIKNAQVLISNCTGVSHMASAFKTQSIVISMDGEPERWAPLDSEIHQVIDWTKKPDFYQVKDRLKQLLMRLN